MRSLKHVHCIGIGGIGVSALAELLLKKGFSVSGSDLQTNAQTEHLAKLGIAISTPHNAKNVENADWVVYSSAISENNPEYVAAKAKNLPLLSRGKALAEFIEPYKVIAVSGTHGKTTTTALTAYLLTQLGFDPSYAIGGIMCGDASPAHLGCDDSPYFVVEADESDATFLHIQPFYAIATNIDVDHLDAYGGDFNQLQESFIQFLEKVPAQGAAIVCIDDPIINALIPRIKSRLITCGFSQDADIRVSDYHQQGLMSCFQLHVRDAQPVSVSLSLSGQHNVQNALAAIAVAVELGASIDDIVAALPHFPGVERRFRCHGQMNLAQGTATVIEDYGHHPSEIKVTIETAKLAWPDKRVVLVFQPHRYTRTRDLYKEFVSVLSEADELFLLDVYAASEEPIDGINSQQLADDIYAKTAKVPHLTNLQSLPKMLHQQLRNSDTLILQGAGSVGSIADDLFLF